jgi:hypothetical protein
MNERDGTTIPDRPGRRSRSALASLPAGDDGARDQLVHGCFGGDNEQSQASVTAGLFAQISTLPLVADTAQRRLG